MTSRSWRSVSRQAAKEKGRGARGIDPQVEAAPFDRTPLAGDQVLDRGDVLALAADVDLEFADRKPELVRVARQGDRGNHRVGPIHRLLHKADDVAVIDSDEAEIAGLLQGRVGAACAIEIADVGFYVAGSVPVAHLDLVFFRIEIFFLARNGLVLEQFETVVDAVGA